MLRHFFDLPGDQFASTSKNKKNKKSKKAVSHTGLESLEERKLLSATLDWATAFAGSSQDAAAYVSDVSTTNDGLTVVAGTFFDVVDFDPSEEVEELEAFGSQDGYVAFLQDGSLLTTTQFSSTGNGAVTITGVHFFNNSELIVAGNFTDGLDVTALGGQDDLVGAGSFLLKLDMIDGFQWAHGFEGTITSMASNDTVVGITGTFTESIDFDVNDSDDDELTDAQGGGGFLALFSGETGDDIYALGLSGDGIESIEGMTFDGTDIIVYGSIGGGNLGGEDAELNTHDGISIDGQAITFETYEDEGNRNAFVARIAEGELDSLVQIAGTDTSRINDVAVDDQGNLYIAGQYQGTIDLNPGVGVEETVNPSQFTNAFYLSLDTDLEYRWGAAINGSEAEAKAVTIAQDGDDQVVLFGGYFNGTVDFDPTVNVIERASEDSAGFVLKLLADQTFVDLFVLEGTGFQNVAGLTTHSDGEKVIVIGNLNADDADVDPGVDVLTFAVTGTSAFVSQLPSNYLSVVDTAYSVAITSNTLPDAVVFETQSVGTMRVAITNDENDSPSASDRVNIRVYARPTDAQSSDEDVLVGEILNQNLNIAQGKFRSYNVPITLPDDLAEGEYNYLVIATDADDESVAQVISEDEFLVAEPFLNLTGTIDDSRLPEAIVEGATPRVIVPVTVTNDGNTSIAAGQRIAITIVARPVDAEDDSEDIEVTVLENQNVSSLRAGASRTFNVSVTLPDDLANDQYNLVAIVDSANAVDEGDYEDDNESVGTAELVVAEAFVNLTGSLDDRFLPESTISGNGDRIRVPVTITNSGNVALEVGQTVNITFSAVTADSIDGENQVDNGGDYELLVLENQNISRLAAGASRTFTAVLTLPAGMSPDDYVISATIQPNGDVEESNEEDNVLYTEASIAVTEGVVNLSATIDDSRLQEELVSGNGDRIILPITITNDGNISLDRTQRIDVTIVARPADAVDDSQDVELAVLENQNVANLGAGQSRRLNAFVTLPAGLESDEYVLVAIVDSGNDVEESDEEDNEAVTDATVDVAIGQYNLTATIDDSRLQEELISGNGDRIILPITITNNGNISLTRTQRIDVTIVARAADAVDDSHDVEVAVLENQNVANLGAGQSRRLNAFVTLPEGLESDEYVLVAIIDSGNDVVESDEEDNEAVTDATVDVTVGEYNLSATLDDSRVAAAIVEGTTPRVIVPVTITNDGNINLPAGQLIQVTIVARPADAVDDSEDVELVVLENQNVSGLRAGTSRTINALFTLPADLDADEYNIVAIIDSNDDVEESDEDDNEAVGATDITVAPAFVNLVASIDDSRLPEATISGDGTRLLVPVTITNAGNVALERGQTVSITLHAKDATDDSADLIDLTVLETANVSGLAAGASRTFNLFATLPAGMDSEDYEIIAIVDSEDVVEESDEDDNEVASEASIAVTEGVVNLSATIDDSRLQEELISGNGDRIILPITITNDGNISLTRTQRIDVTIVARPADAVDDSQDVELAVLENQNVANLRPDQARRINAIVTLPAVLESDEYVLVAIVDSGNDVEESDEEDNEAVTDATVDVAIGQYNLTATIDDSRLQEELISGNGDRIILPITITNDGNISLTRTQRIDVTIVARPADAVDDSDDVEVAVIENLNVANLGAGQASRLNTIVTLPAGLESDEYVLVAIVDSGNDVEESDEEDNEAVTEATVDVTVGEYNLSATIDDSRLQEELISGNGDRIILPITITNNGNISLTRTQRIDVTIVARAADAVDDSHDVEVAVLENQNVANLGAGQSRRLNAFVTLPEGLESDEYVLVAIIDSGNDVVESDEEDNEAVTNETVVVTEGVRDLTVAVDDSRIPSEAVTGSTTRFILPVTITNDGNLRMAPGQRVQLTVEAVRVIEVDGVGVNVPEAAVTVLTFDNASVSNLAPGQSRLVNLSFTLPLDEGFVDGEDYIFRVTVDSDEAVEESEEDNNSAETEAAVTITRGGPNLTVDIDETNLPLESTSGDESTILVPVTVTNDGITRMPSGQLVDIAIYIYVDGEPQDAVLLTTLEDQNISLLQVGQSKTFVASVTLPGTLESETYRLSAVVDPENLIVETNEEDNENQATVTLDVTQGSRDLSVEITEEALEDFLVNTDGTASLTVTLTNEGNLATAADATTQIAIFARPVGAQDSESDVFVDAVDSVDIGALPAGDSVEVDVTDIDLAGLEVGQYVLVALVNDAGLLNSESENSETVTADSFDVTEFSNDLTLTLEGASAGDFVEGETGVGNNMTVNIVNSGETAVPDETTVNVSVYARPVGGGDDILLNTYEDQDISEMPAGQSIQFAANDLDLSGLEAGEYNLVAIVDDSQLDLSSELNNELMVETSFTVTAANHDIAFSRVSHVAENFLQGDDEQADLNTITVRLTNNGNTAIPALTTVTANVYAASTTDSEVRILVAENVEIDISDLAEGEFVDELIDGLGEALAGLNFGSYYLSVDLDDSSLAQADDQNNLAEATSGFEVFA